MRLGLLLVALSIGCGKSPGPTATSASGSAAASPNLIKPIGCTPGARPPISFRIEQDVPLPDGLAVRRMGALADGRLVAMSSPRDKQRSALFIRDGAQWNPIPLPEAVADRSYTVEITSSAIVITQIQTSVDEATRPHIWAWLPAKRAWIDSGERGVSGGETVALTDGRLLIAGGYHRQRKGRDEFVTDSHVWSPKGLTSTAPLPLATNHEIALTPLRDGRVLLTGGGGRDAYLWSAGTWAPTGQLVHARVQHSVSELPDGRVVIAGGSHDDRAVPEIEEWTPATGTWREVGRMFEPREWHTAHVLRDCRVVFTGGTIPTDSTDDSPEALTIEIWNAVDHRSEPPQLAPYTHSGHEAQPTGDGSSLLIAGGYRGNAREPSPHVERWRPIPRVAAPLAIEPLDWPYRPQPLVALPDGDIVLLGANQRWSPATNKLSSIPAPPGKLGHAAVALPDGKLLALSEDQRSLWLLANTTWSPAGKLTIPEQEETRLWPDQPLPFTFTMTALPDGSVFLVGGDAEQLWTSGKLESVMAPSEWRRSHTATRLASGDVLIVGGVYRKPWDQTTHPPAAVGFVFEPKTKEYGTTEPFTAAKEHQSAILLADGNVLITGGTESHIYEPETAKFRKVGALAVAREHHSLVRLPDGRVLALGGEPAGASPRVEAFDPKSSTWSTLGALPEIWTAPHAHVLGPNRVLVIAEGRALILVVK